MTWHVNVSYLLTLEQCASIGTVEALISISPQGTWIDASFTKKKTFFLNVSNCPAFCITLHCLLLTTPELMHLIAIHCFTFFKSSLLIQFSLYFEFSIFVQLFLLFLLSAFIGRSYHAVFLQNIVQYSYTVFFWLHLLACLISAGGPKTGARPPN